MMLMSIESNGKWSYFIPKLIIPAQLKSFLYFVYISATIGFLISTIMFTANFNNNLMIVFNLFGMSIIILHFFLSIFTSMLIHKNPVREVSYVPKLLFLAALLNGVAAFYYLF